MMRVFNIIILAIGIGFLYNCTHSNVIDGSYYFHNKTKQTIRLNHFRLRGWKHENGITIKPNENKEVKLYQEMTVLARPSRWFSTGVFKIIFADGKLLAYKSLWNYNFLLFNSRVFPKDIDFKMPINDKSWKKLASHKALYEITEEDYKKSEYLTHMRFDFVGYDNIPKDYRSNTKIRFYHHNGTQIKLVNDITEGIYIHLSKVTLPFRSAPVINYFAKGKNNFVVPAYTDSCTITFSNGSDKKILKYSGRYDNATRHSPLHKKYWTKQSDTEYYYTITREDFEAAEDL